MFNAQACTPGSGVQFTVSTVDFGALHDNKHSITNVSSDLKFTSLKEKK